MVAKRPKLRELTRAEPGSHEGSENGSDSSSRRIDDQADPTTQECKSYESLSASLYLPTSTCFMKPCSVKCFGSSERRDTLPKQHGRFLKSLVVSTEAFTLSLSP